MNSLEKRDVFVYTRILKYILLKTTPEYTKDLKIKLLHTLTLCMLGNLSCFFVFLADFFKITVFEKIFQENHQCVKQF